MRVCACARACVCACARVCACMRVCVCTPLVMMLTFILSEFWQPFFLFFDDVIIVFVRCIHHIYMFKLQLSQLIFFKSIVICDARMDFFLSILFVFN